MNKAQELIKEMEEAAKVTVDLNSGSVSKVWKQGDKYAWVDSKSGLTNSFTNRAKFIMSVKNDGNASPKDAEAALKKLEAE